MTILVVAVSLLAAPTAAQCTIANVTVSGGVTDPDTGAPARRVTAASPGKKSQREFFVARGAVIERVALNASQGTTVFSAPTRPDAALRYDFGSPITGLHHVHATDELVVVAQRRVWAVPRGDPSSGPRAVGGEVARIVGTAVASVGSRLQVANGSCILEADLADATPQWSLMLGDCTREVSLVPYSTSSGVDIVLPTPRAILWAAQDSMLGIATNDQIMTYTPSTAGIDVVPELILTFVNLGQITAWAGIGFTIQYFNNGSCTVNYAALLGTVSTSQVSFVQKEPATNALCQNAGGQIIAVDRRAAVATGGQAFPGLTLLSDGDTVAVFDYMDCGADSANTAPSADAASDSGSDTTVIIAVVASVGGVLVLGGIVGAILFTRRRSPSDGDASQSNKPEEASINPFNHHGGAGRLPRGTADDSLVETQPAFRPTQPEDTETVRMSFSVQMASTGGTASKMKRALDAESPSDTLSSVSRQIVALSHSDFAHTSSRFGADKARLLRLRAWSDAELVRHNRRCEFVAGGEWRKGKVLGRGANGVVFAVVLPDGSTVAMKEVALGGSAADVDAALREVMHEVELLSRMHHDNLVTYYGIVVDREQHVVRLFMENVTGGSLASMVRDMQEPLPEGTAQRFVRQILRGLAFIHENGVIHRDLKCDNVLRDATTGAVKLADFGTAKAVGNAAGASRAAQTMIGTPYFMAPEILAAGTVEDAEAGYGAKADIWSVGITVAELLDKGHPPWPSFPTPAHAFLHIANPASRPVLPEHLSGHARDFIEACTNRDPKERPSALELLEHAWMQTILDDDEDLMADPASSGELSGRRASALTPEVTSGRRLSAVPSDVASRRLSAATTPDQPRLPGSVSPYT